MPMSHRKKQSRRRREGAAMLVVMALLLVVTATATLAMHSTSIELRSSGNARQRMQTRYVAEGALVSAMTMIEQSGPEPLSLSIERSIRGSAPRYLAPEEPRMAATTGNHRIEMAELRSAPGVVSAPILTGTSGDSLGSGMGYVPNFVVDVNDTYRFTGIIAGHRSDGMGTLEYLAATYTARGRTQLPGRVDAYSPAEVGLDTASPDFVRNWTVRGYHESGANSRAIGISGPTRRR